MAVRSLKGRVHTRSRHSRVSERDAEFPVGHPECGIDRDGFPEKTNGFRVVTFDVESTRARSVLSKCLE
jgi:hypothetical protein